MNSYCCLMHRDLARLHLVKYTQLSWPNFCSHSDIFRSIFIILYHSIIHHNTVPWIFPLFHTFHSRGSTVPVSRGSTSKAWQPGLAFLSGASCSLSVSSKNTSDFNMLRAALFCRQKRRTALERSHVYSAMAYESVVPYGDRDGIGHRLQRWFTLNASHLS